MKALKINKLVKKYWDLEVLKWIDLDIEKWDFFALLWHNWAWKTTTIWIITDLVSKTSWNIEVFWIDIDKDFSSAKKLIWVVPQEFNFEIFGKVIDIPVNQAWYYWIPKKIALERTEKYFKKLWLREKRNSKARELSGWMKRRLMIVRALIHEPKLLILDEPTAWVDVELRNTMWDFIKSLNKNWTTILLTTHYLEEAESLCNKIAILSKWNIIENTTMSNILTKLEEEIFIFDTKNKIKKLPEELIKKCKWKIIWDNNIELSVLKNDNLNYIFKIFDDNNIDILSMRNKSNRLEQLFIKITK